MKTSFEACFHVVSSYNGLYYPLAVSNQRTVGYSFEVLASVKRKIKIYSFYGFTDHYEILTYH